MPGIDTSQASKQWHISELEAIALVAAAHEFGARLARRRVLVRVDNEACVTSFNKGRCSDGGMMTCIRDLWHVKAQHSFELQALHITSEDNFMSDLPSRWTRPDGTRDENVYREFVRRAHEVYGVAEADLREVTPTHDTRGLLLRMAKAHRAAYRRGDCGEEGARESAAPRSHRGRRQPRGGRGRR